MDRVVIVTGAGSDSGIGHAVARRLVAGGDRVAIVDVDADGAERNAAGMRALTGTAVAYACDVGSRAAVMEAAARIEHDLGPAWGLVNCAVGSPPGRAEELDEARWRWGFDVTVGGTFWFCQAVFPQMKARGAGRIVNFGSEVSESPDDTVSLNYIAAKGAVRSLTKGLAREWGRYGITVNTLWPIAATAGYVRWAAENPDAVEALLSQSALHRYGDTHEDIAPVVEFLLSDEARFVTGSTVAANGGRAMP